MTPEELNRTIEFIVESQARLAAAQEHDRHDRLEFQEWAKAMDARLARLLEQNTRLLEHQSERMDRIDKLHEDSLKQDREFHHEVRDFQKQALRLLNLILDRLPADPRKPN